MAPATQPVPVLVLDALKARLALIQGGSDYYHTATFAGFGKDAVSTPDVAAYPVVMIGEPGEVGNTSEADADKRSMMHGDWFWDVPIFGVIQDVGGGDEAYRSLTRLAADVFRAVMTDFHLGGTAVIARVTGWTMLGPQTQTQGRPWVAVICRIWFRTRHDEMVTHPA